MKKSFLNKLLLTTGMTMLVSSAILNQKTMATETTYYKDDVTPPWGRVIIEGGTVLNNISYVDDPNITVTLFTGDDMCAEEEISYYLSFNQITSVPDGEWISIKTGKTVNLTLPDATNAHIIYAAFKDPNGNTSYVSTDTKQTITYNLNGGKYDGSEANLTGIDVTRKYGAPFVITSRMPKKEGVFFLGWSTDPSATEASYKAGDIIPPDVTIAGDTLYAVFTTEEQGLVKLSEVAEVGDFVNYPVTYSNVATTGTSFLPTFNGWRVLSISGDEIKLVSAGVPLTFYHKENSTNSIAALTTNFLNPTFTTVSTMGYIKNGFNPNKTFKEIFTNEYTKQDENNNPIVRSMTKEDLDKVYGSTTSNSTNVTSEKFNSLLAIRSSSGWAYYWLASACGSKSLWLVDGNYGKVDGSYYGSSREFGVRPVVSLKSDVLAVDKDAIGAWNITVAE